MVRQSSSKYSVGGDCDSWCGRCKMDLAHTIVAIVDRLPVKVICNTCKAHHRYRRPKSLPPLRKSGSAKRRSVAVGAKARAEQARGVTPAEAKNRWLDLLAAATNQEHRPYNVKASFAKNETLTHKKFGVGVVLEEQHGKKIRVLFQDSEKILVVNYGK